MFQFGVLGALFEEVSPPKPSRGDGTGTKPRRQKFIMEVFFIFVTGRVSCPWVVYYIIVNLRWYTTHGSMGDSSSVASLGPITPFTPRPLTECNRSRFASLQFQFALILAGTIFALRRWLRNKEWEVVMRTCPLLRDQRHRAMITSVSFLRTRLIHIIPS